jgi:hypothetical protein
MKLIIKQFTPFSSYIYIETHTLSPSSEFTFDTYIIPSCLILPEIV